MPFQVGIGTPCGAEAVCHTVRQWRSRNREARSKVVGLLGLRNAFNCVDRSALRAAARSRVPEIAPWCDFCYGFPSLLRIGHSTSPISSERGIQQGDPLGPLLFSIAIHDLIEASLAECQRLHPAELEVCTFFLDDGCLAGSDRAVKTMMGALERNFGSIGLSLEHGKSEIIPAAGANYLGNVAFENMPVNLSGNFKLLGVPFGAPAFVNAHAAKRAGRAEAVLGELEALDDPQSALHLLRQCDSVCNVVYSMRTTPPDLHREALAGLSRGIREALGAVLHQELDDNSWRLANLGL